ncbi:hypothetical protein OG407_00820 [Streptomyces sp. NBC_01515]|uniref:hypothetical protein n=1 Tax=Streptomyces sp. NBC_01515 TaxID=2903890 RepID=UPI00386E13D0
MNRVLSVASRLSLLVFLLGGTIATFGQIAGLLAFVRVYFKSEQREREAEPVPELPKQRT